MICACSYGNSTQNPVASCNEGFGSIAGHAQRGPDESHELIPSQTLFSNLSPQKTYCQQGQEYPKSADKLWSQRRQENWVYMNEQAVEIVSTRTVLCWGHVLGIYEEGPFETLKCCEHHGTSREGQADNTSGQEWGNGRLLLDLSGLQIVTLSCLVGGKNRLEDSHSPWCCGLETLRC